MSLDAISRHDDEQPVKEGTKAVAVQEKKANERMESFILA